MNEYADDAFDSRITLRNGPHPATSQTHDASIGLLNDADPALRSR